jgi:hypothetical protein
VPPVATLDSDSRVASFAKGHKVPRIIAAALGEREDVVDFLGRRQLALLLTLLTKRMRLDKAVADSLPASAVTFVGLGVPLVLVVLFVHDLLVLGTVLLTLSEPTAAGISTGTLRFVGHWFTSLRA